MPVAAYYLHDPAAPKPNSPTRMGTNVLLECRGRLLLEQRWDCGAWGLPGGESGARGIARELFEETGLRLPEAAFTRVRVVDDADRIASYQDGTVWRMVIVLFRAQLPQEPELHCSRESCTLRFFTPEELRTAETLLREYRFTVLLPALALSEDAAAEDHVLLQGIVDCCYDGKDGPLTVLDFKTDRVKGEELRLRAERYRPQLEAYSKALSRVLERPVGRRILCFLHAGETVEL